MVSGFISEFANPSGYMRPAAILGCHLPKRSEPFKRESTATDCWQTALTSAADVILFSAVTVLHRHPVNQATAAAGKSGSPGSGNDFARALSLRSAWMRWRVRSPLRAERAFHRSG
jgi:hypothetical protein